MELRRTRPGYAWALVATVVVGWLVRSLVRPLATAPASRPTRALGYPTVEAMDSTWDVHRARVLVGRHGHPRQARREGWVDCYVGVGHEGAMGG